jgi:hypothetical protein
MYQCDALPTTPDRTTPTVADSVELCDCNLSEQEAYAMHDRNDCYVFVRQINAGGVLPAELLGFAIRIWPA